ncbi:MAG: HAMP domain-containing histidine kinase [Actinobacteria bacterium]|nr:HAMP domain-containing histidine kinase [Actinomycetota bacterium]
MLGFTKSLKGRFAAYFALSIVITLLVSGIFSVGLVQRYLRQKTVSDLKYQVESLATQIETTGLPQRQALADLEKMYQTRVFIAPYMEQALEQLPRRGPMGDQAEANSKLLPLLDWDKLGRGETQVSETDLPEVDHEVVIAAHGFRAGGELAGAVVLSKPLRLLPSWGPLAWEFLIAGSISLAVSLLLAFLLARRLSKPLHEITQAATAVAEGDFSNELTVRSNDEIGRLADAFRNMSAEVRQAQEQQRQFVINVSHELKTPLTAIAGHAQALQDGVATDPEAVTKSLGVIVLETKRLSRLIEDLLSLAKFDARQFALRHDTVVVSDIIESVADALARDAAGRGISLSADLDAIPETPEFSVTSDPDRLRQILANLVQNALSHTPSGGRVTISARQVPAQSPSVAGHLEIEVADTGRGIAPDDLPHIFDRFYRSGEGARDAGLGLGLSISRELARALGGEITVASTQGQGSRFALTLPLKA